MTQAFPLCWPVGFPRTKTRGASRFKTSLPGAIRNVTDELRRFEENLQAVALIIEAARAAYIEMVKRAHPDKGGDAAAFNRVVDAFRQAREEHNA